ncbi:hypothetical protein [Acinetobacter sp.]|uniref:hypothetical protein n=1 Tax=Acinetobacter sp. TaxID=472 RepID=UPI003D04E229
MTFPASHTFYKKTSALQINLMKPKPEETSGVNGKTISKLKPGAILLEIAKANGSKSYDWENKAMISLSPQEISSIEVSRLTQSGKVSIFHDPGKGTANEGKITRSLTIERTKNNDGYFFNLTEKNNGAIRNCNSILNDEEYYLFRELLIGAIPSLYGWR